MNYAAKLKSKANLGAVLGGIQGNPKGKKRTSSKRILKQDVGILIHLSRAAGLPAADSNGLSDPFVKFRVGKSTNKSYRVEKSLNPSWNEDIFIPVPKDSKDSLRVEVWDWDLIGSNDYLGECVVDISEINWENPIDYEMELIDKRSKGGHQEAGTIIFSVKRAHRSEITRTKAKWVVSEEDSISRQLIVDVVEGKDLLAMDSNGKSDPYVKLEYRGRKEKTEKKRYTTKPQWKERFDFPYDKKHDDQILTIEVFDWDRLSLSDFMGVGTVNLKELKNKNGLVNDIWVPLEYKKNPAGFVHLLISTVNVLKDNKLPTRQKENSKGVVKAHVIQGLKPKGKKNKCCYVEIQVANNKLRSQPVEDSGNPVWERIMELPVKDIFGTIEVALYERDTKYQDPPKLLGIISRPLLEIRNCDTDWFVLKNDHLEKAVDCQLQIAFKFDYSYSGYLGIIGRKDENLMGLTKPKRSIKGALHQMGRVNKLSKDASGLLKKVMTLLNWGYGPQASAAGMFFGGLYFLLFRAFFIPLTMLMGLLYTYSNNYKGHPVSVNEEGEAEAIASVNYRPDPESDDEDESEEQPAENASSAKKTKDGSLGKGKHAFENR
mmetsp:Transcript_25559/g.31437  ORF Transcript_25559/g.31437 Transcript_25559/m.31437 type:complete len:603 (+) Transcript_25559:111-1919(+)